MFGKFTQKKKELELKPAGVTKMMEPKEAMAQEKRFLEILPKIDSYEIGENGFLHLKIDGKAVVVVRRK